MIKKIKAFFPQMNANKGKIITGCYTPEAYNIKIGVLCVHLRKKCFYVFFALQG